MFQDTQWLKDMMILGSSSVLMGGSTAIRDHDGDDDDAHSRALQVRNVASVLRTLAPQDLVAANLQPDVVMYAPASTSKKEKGIETSCPSIAFDEQNQRNMTTCSEKSRSSQRSEDSGSRTYSDNKDLKDLKDAGNGLQKSQKDSQKVYFDNLSRGVSDKLSAALASGRLDFIWHKCLLTMRDEIIYKRREEFCSDIMYAVLVTRRSASCDNARNTGSASCDNARNTGQPQDQCTLLDDFVDAIALNLKYVPLVRIHETFRDIHSLLTSDLALIMKVGDKQEADALKSTADELGDHLVMLDIVEDEIRSEGVPMDTSLFELTKAQKQKEKSNEERAAMTARELKENHREGNNDATCVKNDASHASIGADKGDVVQKGDEEGACVQELIDEQLAVADAALSAVGTAATAEMALEDVVSWLRDTVRYNMYECYKYINTQFMI
jgi:hypothetical protein